MENIINCNVCRDADPVLGKFIKGLPVETSHHRVESQSVKCGFGLQGVCCRLCANGPCRVTPDGPRGVCGADADTIVARNFLRAVAAGAGCYIHVIETSVRMLASIAKEKKPIANPRALRRLAEKLGIERGEDIYELALKVTSAIRQDLYLEQGTGMTLTRRLAYGPRYERWKELGILPGGAKSEVFEGVVKTSTNLSSDPVEMLLHCLTLGIATGLYGLQLTNLINDAVVGDPKIRVGGTGLGIIDPEYINLMVTGHQESLFIHIMERIASPAAAELARSAGAKGFRVVGCTCVGQDMQQRAECYGEYFYGNAGNNFTSEAILATGAVDGVISEFNCTLPGIETVCETYDIVQICIDKVAKKKNAELMDWDDDSILDKIAEAYCRRRKNVKIHIPDHGFKDSMAGISEINLKQFLGGEWKPLLDLIVSGKIKGIVGVVGCSSVREGHDVLTVQLTRELIKRDILVLTAGCSSGALANCGLTRREAALEAGAGLREICQSLGIPPVLNFGPCIAIGRLEMAAAELAEELSVDMPQLPLAFSAAQWLEEQALADGAFGLSLGLTLHLGLPPYMTGSKTVVQVLTKDMETLTGGRLIIDNNPKTAADQLEAAIMDKRKALNI